MAITVKQSCTCLMVVHFDEYGGEDLRKPDMTKLSMIPWLLCVK